MLFFWPFLIFIILFYFFGDRNVQSSPFSIKDQEEKAKRCEFVHGLLLSTILDDNL